MSQSRPSKHESKRARAEMCRKSAGSCTSRWEAAANILLQIRRNVALFEAFTWIYRVMFFSVCVSVLADAAGLQKKEESWWDHIKSAAERLRKKCPACYKWQFVELQEEDCVCSDTFTEGTRSLIPNN